MHYHIEWASMRKKKEMYIINETSVQIIHDNEESQQKKKKKNARLHKNLNKKLKLLPLTSIPITCMQITVQEYLL